MGFQAGEVGRCDLSLCEPGAVGGRGRKMLQVNGLRESRPQWPALLGCPESERFRPAGFLGWRWTGFGGVLGFRTVIGTEAGLSKAAA